MLAFHLGAAAFAPALPTSRVAPRASSIQMAEMSKALPFTEKPAALDGSMAGDVGFDPLGFATAFEPFPLAWMREAEIKHGAPRRPLEPAGSVACSLACPSRPVLLRLMLLGRAR